MPGIATAVRIGVVLGAGVGLASLWGCGAGLRRAASVPPPTPGAALRDQAGFDVVHWRSRSSVRIGSRTVRGSQDNWARLSTLARYFTSVPGSPRTSGSASAAVEGLSDPRGTLTHDGRAATWTYSRLEPRDGYTTTDLARYTIQSEALPPGMDTDGYASSALRLSPWTKQAVRLDGRPAVRWQREAHLQSRASGVWLLFERRVAWTDRGTGRLIRKQVKQFQVEGHGPPDREVVSDEFSYDQAPPAHTLDMRPPGGATVWLNYAGSPVSPFTRKWDASLADRDAVMRLIHQSEWAWVKGQFGVFSGQWDFAQTTEPPGRAFQHASADTWRGWMTEENGKWLRLASRPHSFYHATLADEYMHRTLPPSPDAMYVITTATVRLAGDPYELTTHFGYTLRHSLDGWRIVDWSWRPHYPMVVASTATAAR